MIIGFQPKRAQPYVAMLTGAMALMQPAIVRAQARADGPQPQSTGLEEIVVTAQKREQNLQVVPISITALGAQELEANRIVDVRDLSALAPNLTVRIASGGAAIPTYSMRGIVTSGAAPGTDKGISLYVDGVYIQNVQGSIFQLADIERIEVLKGPQGTLFGRNATGGAISIITHTPTGKFDVKQEFTYGNYDQLRSRTRVDLPKVGPVSASFAYVHSERRGDTLNLGAGTNWDYGPATGGERGILTSPKYLGDENIDSFVAALKFDLADNLNFMYKFDYAQNHYTPEAQGIAATNFGALGPATAGLLNALIVFNPRPSSLTPVSTSRPDAVNDWFATPSFTHNMGHNLTARYEFNDSISLKNILAFRSSGTSTTYQLDGMGGLYNVISPRLGPIGAPYIVLANNGYQQEKQWSNETQLNIDTDWFTLTAGYIHFYDSVASGGFQDVANTTQFTAVAGQRTTAAGTPFVIPFTGTQLTTVKVNSDAWFVQPEVHLTHRLDLVLGSRLTRDRKDGVDRTVVFPGPNPYADIHYRNSKETWLAGVNFRPTDNILTYAKYATGYISGGFLATREFDPETAKSFEAGVKADLFDRRLRSNLAVFKANYNGIQLTTTGRNVGVPQASQVVINGGDGKARGFEWENTVLPVSGLTLTTNVGYTDFEFTQLVSFFGTSFLAIQRPKWTGNAAVQYETPELFSGGHLMLRMDVNYKSKTNLGSTHPTEAIANAVTTPDTWIANARVALADMDWVRTKATVALWGRNLFDCRQLANVAGLGFEFPGSYERARTFGVDVSFEF